MPEEAPKKNTWNNLLTVMIIAVICLIVLLVYLFVKRQSILDISFPYTPSVLSSDEYTYGHSFSDNYVLAEQSVTIDGVVLDSTTEKGLLFNTDTNEAVFAQGIYDKAYPASITKLMTAILAARDANMSDIVTMEEADFDMEEGSQVSGLIPGDMVTMEELFYMLVVYSANDAANAIARHMEGSVGMFVERMNLEASELGMKNTHFENPHGLHSKDHYTCAYDIYIMMNEAIKYQIFLDAVHLSVYHLSVERDGMTIIYDLSSTDRYLTGDENLPPGVSILAGKTGTTDEAGACLALAVQDNRGVPYVAVVLNAYNKDILYEDMNKLLNSLVTD